MDDAASNFFGMLMAVLLIVLLWGLWTDLKYNRAISKICLLVEEESTHKRDFCASEAGRKKYKKYKND